MFDCFVEFPEFPFDKLNQDIAKDMDEDYMKGLHSARAYIDMKYAEFIKNPTSFHNKNSQEKKVYRETSSTW